MSVRAPVATEDQIKVTRDIARRFPANPILSPGDLRPSMDGLEIACLLNPGVFRFDGKIWLLVRVAERPRQSQGKVSFPILDKDGTIRIIELDQNDPDLRTDDPRTVTYQW